MWLYKNEVIVELAVTKHHNSCMKAVNPGKLHKPIRLKKSKTYRFLLVIIILKEYRNLKFDESVCSNRNLV